MGLAAYRLAKDIFVPLPPIHEITKGDRGITVDKAIRLGIYFGLPAQFWLNLQNDYDLRMPGRKQIEAKVKPRKAA